MSKKHRKPSLRKMVVPAPKVDEVKPALNKENPKQQSTNGKDEFTQRPCRENREDAAHKEHPTQEHNKPTQFSLRMEHIMNAFIPIKRLFNWWNQNRLLVLFNGILALFSVLLWRTAEKQWTIGRQNLILSERPWVGMSTVNIDQSLAHSLPMRISVPIQNGGHSPGLHVIVHGGLELHSSDEIISDKSPQAACNEAKPKWNDAMGGSMVLPNINSLVVSMDSPVVPDSDIACIMSTGSVCEKPGEIPPHFSAANLPRMGLYIVGCIDYFDEFHTAHRSYLCEAYWPLAKSGGTFYFCPKGNSAD